MDPTKEKRGPGRKARKQKGAETELVRFLPAGWCFCPVAFQWRRLLLRRKALLVEASCRAEGCDGA